MAKHVVLSVLDRSVGAFGRPLFVPSVGAGVRSFQDEVNRAAEDNVMYKHPEDFILFELGSFDDALGTFENSAVAPREIATASSVRT